MTAHHHYTIPCGLLLLAIGLFIRYHIGRRRFNRRGIGGLQQFSNYRMAVTIRFLESIIFTMGSLCLLAGLFLLAVAGYTHLKF
jgi:hypothetical protein